MYIYHFLEFGGVQAVVSGMREKVGRYVTPAIAVYRSVCIPTHHTSQLLQCKKLNGAIYYHQLVKMWLNATKWNETRAGVE